jgi:hypothetical protein
MEAHREAAANAAISLGHDVRRSEDFGASSQTPQIRCLEGVRWAHAVIVLIGERYGDPQKSGLSATHKEYREAKERTDVLIFVQATDARDAQQEEFLSEVRDWASGATTETYTSSEELAGLVTRRLHELELARATGQVDEEEVVRRAMSLLPDVERSLEATLTIVIAGAPAQPVLRPAEIEDPALVRLLQQEALLGDASVLNIRKGTNAVIESHALVLAQGKAFVSLQEGGEIVVHMALDTPKGHPYFEIPVVIEEDIRTRIERALRFGDEILERIDPTHRLSHAAVVVKVQRGGYRPWRTREEQDASPNSYEVPIGGPSSAAVSGRPPHRPRAALRQDVERWAADLTVLLRRDLK